MDIAGSRQAEFDRALFGPSVGVEGHLLERKARIPHIRGSNPDENEELAEFIRDLIALANASFSHGEPAHMLFGVDDGGELLKDGIRGQATNPRLAANCDYDRPASVRRLTEQILRDFAQITHEYIGPATLLVDFRAEEIDGRLLGYLTIRSGRVPQPYEVIKEIRRVISPLSIGDAWMRLGESKKLLTSAEKGRLICGWLFAPTRPDQWQRYFDSLSSGPFSDAYNLQGYQEPVALSRRVQQFTESSDSLLVIEGRAGSGKSIFLRRWVCEQALAARPIVDQAGLGELPSAVIPVFHEMLDERMGAEEDLAALVMAWINLGGLFGATMPPEAISLLAAPGARWVLCLDGLDEMAGAADIRHFYAGLKRFLQAFPHVKALITARPDAVAASWRAERKVETIPDLSRWTE